MTPFNENWERWCRISINKHFNDGKGDTECFIEGFVRDTNELTDYIEIRVDGPYIRETLKDKWKLYFEINVLIVVKTNHKDAYRINRLSGRIQKLFLDCIEVRRWGDSPEDDLTILGCLSLTQPAMANEKIQVSHFGKINPTSEILQSTVEGHYILRID